MALSANLPQANSQERSDVVAYWNVPLCDGVHTVEFEHGTTSGKRVLRIDGQEIIRRDWMFKLVGEEHFRLGKQKTKCELRVDPLPHFTFCYSLIVDKKPFEKFTENQSRALRTWAVQLQGTQYRIVLERQVLDVWVNGERVETESCFTQGGTEMKFLINETEAVIKASSTNKREGVLHELYVEGNLIECDGINQ